MSTEKGRARCSAHPVRPFSPFSGGYAFFAAHSAHVPKISTVCATFT